MAERVGNKEFFLQKWRVGARRGARNVEYVEKWRNVLLGQRGREGGGAEKWCRNLM